MQLLVSHGIQRKGSLLPLIIIHHSDIMYIASLKSYFLYNKCIFIIKFSLLIRILMIKLSIRYCLMPH